MKAKLIFILIVAMTVGCKNTENEFPQEIYHDLVGNVIFMRGRRLEMANVNSMNNSTYHGNATDHTRPVWAHEGTRFAAIEMVSSEASGMSAYFEIKIIDVENDSVTHWKIGDSKNINLHGPLTWSPDGLTIAFLEGQGSNEIIYLDTQNGDTVHTKFSMDLGRYITTLAWHPDGKRIAVNISTWRDFQHDNNIWMIEPFDTNLKNHIPVTTGGRIQFLDWNSDGSKLLYSYSNDDIFIINSDGSGHRKIPNINGHAPCWSRDGEYILYTGTAGTSGSTLIFGIFVTDINGSSKKLLLENAGYCDWY